MVFYLERRHGMTRIKIGITGGSGYVGFSLARYLSRSFKVKILDIEKPQKIQEIFDHTYCDVRRYDDVKRGLSDVDLVIHCAIVQIPLINEQKRLGYEVNVIGTQNVCEATYENPRIKGLILTSSWHTMGEKGLKGVIDEEFGFRPDKVEDRARLYALSKIAQESIDRFYDEFTDKVFGVIRMGTVLGEGMPKKTAANIFIENALKGRPITPFRHSMYRPMFYVDLNDIVKAYDALIGKIINDELKNSRGSLEHVINVYHPESITIFELAQIVRDAVIKYSSNRVIPHIQVIDTGKKTFHVENEKPSLKANMNKALTLLNLKWFKHPRDSIEQLVRNRLAVLAKH